MPETISKLYCCVRCINGKAQKFSSPRPCAEGYQTLPCSQGANPCTYWTSGEDVSGYSMCQKNCDQTLEKGSPEWTACIEACVKTKEEEKKKKEGTGGCGKGKVTSGAYPNGRDWTGCSCSAAYFPNSPGVCQDGYVPVGSGADARCECVKYQNEVGDEWGENKIQGGTFEFSPDVKALMARLMQRANWLLDNPGGMTAEERAMIQNRAAEGIKGAERGILQSTRDTLGRMGLLGSGVQLGEESRVRRGTTQALAASQRDIAIEEAARKVSDMLATTGMSSQLTTGAMGADTTVEALNAARRSESKDYMKMLLDYLSSMMSGSNAAWGPYYQALATRYNTPTNTSTSASSWLPYLLMMMGMK